MKSEPSYYSPVLPPIKNEPSSSLSFQNPQSATVIFDKILPLALPDYKPQLNGLNNQQRPFDQDAEMASELNKTEHCEEDEFFQT